MPTSESRDTTTTTITAALTTAKSPAASATSQPVLSTRAMQLSLSERNLTITFSCILGFFALVVVAVKFNRCIHKTQFLHQPLHNIEDLNGSTTGNTLISRGLHDGHPIYDNVPPAGQDEAHFSLEFLH
uniref:Uncharacterized protein n=1 Tax=Knipowitschia caucasica TaxID=637954 RepID=A0AAV2M6U5_KNICA